MKKRILVMFMAVVMLFVISACSNSATESYKTMAQNFIDEGDIESARKTLEDGIAETNSKDLQTMLDGLSGVDFSDYDGLWAVEDLSYENGGMILNISTYEATTMLSFECAEESVGYSDGPLDYNILKNEVDGSTVTIKKAMDIYENLVDMTINFDNDTITCKITNIEDGGNSSFLKEGTYKLVKNEDAYTVLSEVPWSDSMGVKADGFTEAPAYDTSKASGILAQAGLTEAEFKAMSMPVMSQYYHSNEIAYARGRQYYAEHPDENTMLDYYTKNWNDYKTNAKQLHSYSDSMQWDLKNSQTLDDFLNFRIYGPKGAHVIWKESEAVFERMFEYPQEYVGKPFLLKNFEVDAIENYKYTLHDYITYNATIIVTDRRNDVMNPTVLKGNYDMYVVFDGNGTTYSGDPVLYFSVLFLNKCE